MHVTSHSTYSNFCEEIDRKEESTMNNHELIIKTTKNDNDGGTGYKIIEIKVNDPSENLFAVVTPIKMK